MGLWVAVDFRRRRLKNFCPESLAKAEHVDCAMHARLGGLHRVALVMDRRGRTRQVIDLVGFHIQRNRHVVPQHFEVGIVEKMFDILLRTAEKIVYAENVTSLRE